MSATVTAAVLTVALAKIKFEGSDAGVVAKTTLITAGVTTIACIIDPFVTKPEPTEKLASFYRRVHPSIYGWQAIANLCPQPSQVRYFAAIAAHWVARCVMA